jgi:serine/threonine protein kinase
MEYGKYSEESPHNQTDVKTDLDFSKYSSFGLEGLTLPFGYVRKLGSGGHGQVDEVYNQSSSEHFVRKSVRRKRVETDISSPMSHLKNELSVLKELSHPNLVKLVGAYTDATYCHLIMYPVADQNLADLMRASQERPQDPSDRLLRWVEDLCSALVYLHGRGVKHLDIKPQNILVKGDQILLADFGTAKSILSDGTTSYEKVVVTPMYCAPETINHGQQDFSADIFSLGCVFSEMITCYLGHTLQEFEDSGRNI